MNSRAALNVLMVKQCSQKKTRDSRVHVEAPSGNANGVGGQDGAATVRLSIWP
jgi:hypothetical protein